MKTRLAIAALVATTLGLGAFSAFAQDTSTSATPTAENGPRQMHRMTDRHGGPGMRMGGPRFLMLSCSDRGAEELDVALTRLSHRVGELTAEQKALFDTLREKALTEATAFADACKAARPAKADDAAKPDMLAMMKAGIGIEEARLAALKDVLPAFEAFYNSLTDAQKANLMPKPRDGGRMIDHGAKGRMLLPPADADTDTDGAPPTNG